LWSREVRVVKRAVRAIDDTTQSAGASDQRQKARQDRGEASLQPAWRADANQLPHEQAEIEATGVNQ
jgi:hypothetical protein